MATYNTKTLLLNQLPHIQLQYLLNNIALDLMNRFLIISKSNCGRADNVIDSHTTGPGFKTRWVRYIYFLPSFLLTTTVPGS